MLDSLNGYLNAMPGERFLNIQLHEILAYLGQKGVATLLVAAHQGLIGPAMSSPVDATYLADSVVLLRYFEARGEIRQAISVIKRRGGEHERTIREFRLEAGGIRLGEPLRQFRGILTGTPVYEGADDPLLATEDPHERSIRERARNAGSDARPDRPRCGAAPERSWARPESHRRPAPTWLRCAARSIRAPAPSLLAEEAIADHERDRLVAAPEQPAAVVRPPAVGADRSKAPTRRPRSRRWTISET